MHTPSALLVGSPSVIDLGQPAANDSRTREEIERSVQEAVASEMSNLGSDESRRSYEHVWRYFRAWLVEQQVGVLAVRPRHVQSYVAKLRDEGKKRGTIGRALSVICTMYRALVRDELMLSNPAREIKRPKMDMLPKAPWIANPADIEKLLNVPAANWVERRDRTIVRSTFGLGWRRAEIARICTEDIDGDVITAPRIKGGKRLVVGLPDWLAEDIFEWRQFASIDSGPLFRRSENGDRRQINGAVVYRVVRQACAKAGIEVVPPHALRRTMITHSGLRGVDLKKRQLSVGHSSSTITEGYDRARDASYNKVGDVFANLVRA